jgi:hypothetical protein
MNAASTPSATDAVRHPVALLRRNMPFLGFMLGTLLLGTCLAFAGHTLESTLAGIFCMVWSGVITPFVIARNPFPRPRQTFAVADDRGLAIEGLPFMERSRILQAYVQPGPTGSVLQIMIAGRGTLVLVSRPEHAAAIVRSLGVDASRKTATIAARSPVSAWVAWPGGFALVVAVFVGAINFLRDAYGGPACIAALAVWAVLLLLWSWPARVTIGADGVEVRWLGRRRYYAFSEMMAPKIEGRAVHLDFPRKRSVTLVAKKSYDAESRQGADDQALAMRLLEAYSCSTSAGDRDPSLQLARGGRTVRDWLSHLDAIGARRHEGYRSASLTDEQLEGIVLDPGASPTRRAGAAAVLARSRRPGAPDVRAEIARAADACAHPRLRVALDSLAKSEREAEWAEALDGLVDVEEPGPPLGPQ